MATVFKATRERHNDEVALKVLIDDSSDDEETIGRFIEEYTLTEKLNHPNIVQVYGQGFEEEQTYIVMEYLQSGSLKDKIRRGLVLEEVLSYTEQIASALEHLHSSGIIHRDLKPANVLFRDKDTAVISDFGIAKDLVHPRAKDFTVAGTIIGTLTYASPEQVQGKPLDQRSDQYCLGLLFYEMLVGKRLFSGKTPIDIAEKHISQPPPALPQKYTHIQPVMDRLLAKLPDDRFETSSEALAAIQKLRA